MEVAAQPEAFGFDPKTTALIVVDMQNAYATKGGYVDLAGFDVSGARSCIENISKVTKAGRDAGVMITLL